MEVLIEHGTAEQKERCLEPLVRGEIRSCFTMTEPEFAGSNPVWLGTTARKDGDDWVIRGHKWFASSADGAAFAVCMAVTNPDAADPYQRASMILVPTDTPGFELIGNISVMGERGGDWASHGEVSYHGRPRAARQPPRAREGEGFVIAQERLGPGRIHHCMRWIGICERALDILCRHAATRELAPGVRSARSRSSSSGSPRAGPRSTRRGCWSCTRRGRSSGRGRAPPARRSRSSSSPWRARSSASSTGRSRGSAASGMTDDTPLAYWYAHERAARIYDGADEVHVESVARRILRGYGMTDAMSA